MPAGFEKLCCRPPWLNVRACEFLRCAALFGLRMLDDPPVLEPM